MAMCSYDYIYKSKEDLMLYYPGFVYFRHLKLKGLLKEPFLY
jgi:hypothetical protein